MLGGRGQRGPYVMLGIKARLAACKKSILTHVLALLVLALLLIEELPAIKFQSNYQNMKR